MYPAGGGKGERKIAQGEDPGVQESAQRATQSAAAAAAADPVSSQCTGQMEETNSGGTEMVGLPFRGQRQHNKMVADRPRREGKVTGGRQHREDKVAADRLRTEGKAASGRSREGSTTASQRQQKKNRLRGGRSIFAVHRGREMAGDRKSEDSEDSESGSRNGGAAEETAAIDVIDWNDEELWLSALAEAGISWSGSVEEFCESDIGGARIEWEKGVDGLRSRIRDMVADMEIREPVVRTAAAFRDAFEQMSWRGKESRFAAFVQEAMEGLGGVRECSSSEELAQVEEEMAELEEKLLALRVKQQELAEAQKYDSVVTVSGLAANVTSDMLRATFAQVGVVVEVHVQYDGETGHSLGWGTVSFERPEDAVEAMGFDGVALVGVAMVVETGDGREWDESLEGEPEPAEGALDQDDQ